VGGEKKKKSTKEGIIIQWIDVNQGKTRDRDRDQGASTTRQGVRKGSKAAISSRFSKTTRYYSSIISQH